MLREWLIMFKKFFLIKCSCTLVQQLETRASELGLTIPEYFKYLAIKDVENKEIMKTKNEIRKDGKYPG